MCRTHFNDRPRAITNSATSHKASPAGRPTGRSQRRPDPRAPGLVPPIAPRPCPCWESPCPICCCAAGRLAVSHAYGLAQADPEYR